MLKRTFIEQDFTISSWHSDFTLHVHVFTTEQSGDLATRMSGHIDGWLD